MIIEKAGGEWRTPAEYEGSIGRTMFDTPGSEDGTVSTLMPRERLESLPMQSLVRIKSVSDGRSYLGAVVKGPFAEPDGLRADSPILTAVTVHGGIMLPKYHGRVQIGILGEELPEGEVVPPRRRPLPNSPVFSLDRDETARFLRTGGDIRLGLTVGLILIFRKTATLFGGIDDALWSWLTNLAPGQAIISFTSLARPLLTTIDPTPCWLLMVE